jgi:hypothetical protein
VACIVLPSVQVNQLLMTHTWSNFTFDSMAVENLAPGDAKSAELARPLSVSSANNFWPLYYNRSQDRLRLKNVTFVVGSQVGASCNSSITHVNGRVAADSPVPRPVHVHCFTFLSSLNRQRSCKLHRCSSSRLLYPNTSCC